MKPWKGKGRLITIILMVSVIVISLIPLANLYSYEEEQTPKDEKIVMDVALYEDLRSRQRSDGSWDDYETTMIASNAIVQNNILLEEHVDKIEFKNNNYGDSEQQIQKNEESMKNASTYTNDNYQEDAPLTTQIMVNNNLKFLVDINTTYNNASSIIEQSGKIIESSQEQSGSWNDDIRLTSLSLFTLKRNPKANEEIIARGEDWLIEKRNPSGSWGSVKNDSLATLALFDTDIDLTNAVNNLVANQKPDGSFGDIETTAWATIGLSLYASEESIEAATKAREWLLAQDEFTDREVALTSLADVEYMVADISRSESEEVFYKEKGPPLEFYILLGIVIISVIMLLIVNIRLKKMDILDGTRKNVYEFIKNHAGANQNQIKRELGLSSSSTRHHLEILRKNEYIITHDDGRYLRYYANQNGYSLYTNGNGYKEVISLLRKKTASRIVEYLIEHPETNQKAIAEALELNPSTIHWHAKLLLKEKIIVGKKIGKTIKYSINDPANTIKLLGYAN
jgi:predicted transcriptional regulator